MPIDAETLPATVAELAASCVKFVNDALGLPLDYTAETLPIVDHYVRTKAGETGDEVRDLLTPMLGAYFGEVVQRCLPGARWHLAGTSYADYRIEFDPFFLCFNPLGVAAEVLAGDDAEGFGAHFQLLDEERESVESALARDATVSADDYYSFTMRFEALECIVSALVALDRERGEKPRHFGPDVYRAAAGESVGKGSPS